MGPLSSPDGAVLEIIGNRKELKHSIGGELHGASTKSGDFDNITGVVRLPVPGQAAASIPRPGAAQGLWTMPRLGSRSESLRKGHRSKVINFFCVGAARG